MSTFYRPVGSYSLSPHQRNHFSYPNPYYPNWELASPQINGDPSRPPVVNEPWPCGGGYSYFNPAECHGCCASSYFPVCYGFRPPHSHHLPPPLPHYNHGPYPQYPEVYPSYYVPPPHYSVGQPRYEYDKNIPGSNHCCGCPNHKCSSKVSSNVKIEEQEPEAEKAERKSSAVYQKPIVWIPPGYVKDEDGSLCSKQGPQVWNGCLPFDMSNTKSLKQGGEEGKRRDEPNEENRCHFPYPIIWMPGYEKPEEAETKDVKDVSSVTKSPEETPSKQYQHNEEKKGHFPFPFFWMPTYDKRPEPENTDLKEVSNDTKSAEEVPSKIKTIPVKLLQNDDRGEKPGVADDTTGVHAKVAEEQLKSKSIPVKQMEDFEEKKLSGGTGTATKSIPVKHMEENANKSTHGSTKSQPGSPKASKLPPVCLRVDPLPRRKNGNGNSRSPSPPGENGKLQRECNTTFSNSSDKGKESQDLKTQDPSPEKVPEEQAGKKDRKAIEIEKSRNNVPVVSKEVPEILVREVEIDEKDQQSAKEAVQSKTDISEDSRKNKVISEREAAVLIQSAYRGYEVRKWETLKKLRQVGKVRDQLGEVRERIRALESSTELQRDKKQKLTIGETIMGFLLQLDVIQGLHPSLRDIRKSVARDLVSLQERLDSVASPESEESKLTVDAPMNVAKPVRENISGTDDVGVPLGQNEEEKPSELLKAPFEEPISKMEPTGSDAEEVEVGQLTNEVLADSSAQWEEKVLEPPVDNKEVEKVLEPPQNEEDKPSEPSKALSEEPTSKMEHTGSDAVEIEVGALTNEVLADSSAQCEEEVLEPPVEDKEVEKDSERVSPDTDVEPCLVRESIESSEMVSKETEYKAPDVEPSIDMEEEEKSNTDSETVVEKELECKPQGLDEFQLVVDSVTDQPKEAEDDVEMPLGVLEGTQSSDTEQNVEHVTRRGEEPDALSTDPDVEHVKEERLENADSDSKPDHSNLQPSAKENFTDEELMKTPETEDSAATPQWLEERKQEKLVEDQMVASVDSSQAVSTPPSDSTDHMIASQAEGVEVIVKESKDVIPETEVPKIDGCRVKEVGNDCLPSIQLEAMEAASEATNVTEIKDGADRLETVTVNGVDHNPYDSEMVEAVVSSTVEMEGEITSSDPVAQVSHEQAPKILDVIQGGQVAIHSRDLAEDNKKLKEMLEKLVQAGKEQLSVIADLNGRIKDLEGKLKSKKKMRMRPRRVAAVSSAKRSNGLGKRNDVTCAA